MFIAACHLRDGNGAMGVPRPNKVDRPLGRNPREGGFTLIEVMIVVAIIGIGSALAIPAYNQWIARYELRQAIVAIGSNLTMARMTAKNRNMAVISTLATTATGRVTMITTNVPGTVIFASDTFPMTVTSALDAATPIGTPLPPPVTIAFTPLGILGAGTSPLPVLITNSAGLAYSAVVAPSGKVNWCIKATCP